MHDPQPPDDLIVEAHLFRLIDIHPRAGVALRERGVLVPDQRVGRLRFYYRTRLDLLAGAAKTALTRKLSAAVPQPS